MTGQNDSTTAPATRGYVSLHTHTEFSGLDGIARLGNMLDAVAADGQPAVSMTDHGNFAGAWKFVNEAKKRGIKPIIGEEFYVALVPEDGFDFAEVEMPEHVERGTAETPTWLRPEVRFARYAREGMDAETGKSKRNTNNHLTILAATEQGYRNLCLLANKAEESFYMKPLIDYALLKEHSEGLIVLSGCLGGPVASHVSQARTDVRDVNGALVGIQWDETRLDEAREGLRRLATCVGAENVYVEIMEHGLNAEGWHHIAKLAQIGKEVGAEFGTVIDVVATNDSHYVHDHDCDAHDAWLVVGELQRGTKDVKILDADGNDTGRKEPMTVNAANRWRFNGSGYWMRTEAEMRAIYPDKAGWQRAVDNTVAIAERVQGIDETHPYGVIPFKKLRLPRFPVPAEAREAWEAGAEVPFVGTDGVEHPARQVGKGVYRSPSAFHVHNLVLAGARERYGDLRERADVRERLRFEEDVIFTLGLEDYFLIVSDVIEWCRSDRGLPTTEFPLGQPGGKKPILVGPGRGSAAGSAYSYALKIVMVDPLENGLLFERFLDIDRVGMPDIDVDFEAARRDEVYDYLAARYGRDFVARIGAFQNAKTKRAIKDSARALGYAPKVADDLNKLVPVKQGQPHTFAMIFEEVRDKETGEIVPNPEAGPFRAAVARDPDLQKIVELARKIEGVAAGVGIHAAGVIISDEPLSSLIPMRLLRKDGVLASQVPIALWDGTDIDKFGMLKLDALGLTNLDIVAMAVEHIRNTAGEVIDPDALPHPDARGHASVDAAFELLREGRTQGVFQCASEGITDLIRSVAPTRFSDLSATLALYRPGPMGANMHLLYADRKNGRSEVDYGIFSPDKAEQDAIAKVLGDTYGTIIFQEEVMALAYEIADFTPLERSDLRKAVSKKNQSEIDRLKVIFMEKGRLGTRADGTAKVAFTQETLDTVWVTFNASAAYLFNKSHTVAYGQLSYVTAYFKANFPTEYAAATLGVIKDPAKRVAALRALHEEGIKVLAPDVNASAISTAPHPSRANAIVLGLSEIKDVGVEDALAIVAERDSRGEFRSLSDVIDRVRVRAKTKSGLSGDRPIGLAALRALVEAGAMDSFGPRLGLLIALGAANQVVPQATFGPLDAFERQRSRVGMGMGTSPLLTLEDSIAVHDPYGARSEGGQALTRPSVDVDAALKMLSGADRASLGTQNVLGILTAFDVTTTRRGQRMAKGSLMGFADSVNVVVFPSTYAVWERANNLPRAGQIVIITGEVRQRIDSREGTEEVINDEGEVEIRTVEQEVRTVDLVASHAVTLAVDAPPAYGLASDSATASVMASWNHESELARTFATYAPRTRAHRLTATRPEHDDPTLEPVNDTARKPEPVVEPETYEAQAVTQGEMVVWMRWARGISPQPLRGAEGPSALTPFFGDDAARCLAALAHLDSEDATVARVDPKQGQGAPLYVIRASSRAVADAVLAGGMSSLEFREDPSWVESARASDDFAARVRVARPECNTPVALAG